MPKYKGLNKEICQKCCENNYYTEYNTYKASLEKKTHTLLEWLKRAQKVNAKTTPETYSDIQEGIEREKDQIKQDLMCLKYYLHTLKKFNERWEKEEAVQCPKSPIYYIPTDGEPPEECPFTLEHVISKG